MEPTRQSGRNRRSFVATGIAAGSAALAGCLSGSDSSETETGSYTVSMAPMGEVEFDGVPEDAFVAFPQYADMAVALGHGDAVTTLFAPDMSGPTMDAFYERLEGVSFEWAGLQNPLENGLSEEQLYALDSDVHFLDPSYVVTTDDDWTASDIADIAETIGPWIGSFHSGVHSDPAPAYADSYEYYTSGNCSRRSRPSFGNGTGTRRSPTSTRRRGPASSRTCPPRAIDRPSPGSRWETACSTLPPQYTRLLAGRHATARCP